MEHTRKSSGMIGRLLAVMVSVLMVLSGYAASAEAAVTYSGNGTSASPYLIYTAEQLDGMRNNLSAHYKLANTIDAASLGTFQPIGILSRPFKGSLTCDTNADGTPKYVIKNLKLYNDAGEKYGHTLLKPDSYTDYSLNNSKWETGLFGATSGAIIENIVILDADVTSTVLGQHDQNSDYTINPGMREEQGTGILAGIIKNTQIKGCGATGKIVSKSNNTGGLIGLSLDGSSISNSWVQAQMQTSGAKEIGGFLGMGYTGGTTISNCFSNSNITHTIVAVDGYAVGGFIGNTQDVTVNNSCATGSINMGYSFILSSWNASTVKTANCYSAVKTPTTEPINSNVIAGDACYVLNGGMQPGWEAVNDSALKSAFAGNSAWDTAGQYPVPKDVAVVTDASAYVPSTNVETPEAQAPVVSSGGAATTDPGNAQAPSGETDMSALVQTIEAWPDAESITIDYKQEVKEAKRAYDQFGDAEFAAFPEDAYTKLMSVCDRMYILILSNLATEIEKLPAVKDLTLDDADKVLEFYDDYNFLPEDTQKLLREDYVKQLKASVEQIETLQGKADGVIVSGAVNPAETVLIVVLCVLSLGCFGISVWVLILFLRLKKASKATDAGDTSNDVYSSSGEDTDAEL